MSLTTLTTTETKKMTDDQSSGEEEYKATIVWPNVFKFSVLHLLGINALLLFQTVAFETVIFSVFLWIVGCVSITAGSHRLWSHRSYKASLPLRIFLMLTNCIAMENSIFVWARDHRVHHKFSETTADPHDANRGFFFAHIGWLLVRKHPEVTKKGAKIDLSDLRSDPVVMFQHRHYIPLALTMCIVIPTWIPVHFWGEALWTSYVCSVLRYLCILHSTWLVNSVAHMWGGHDYDINISPAQNRLVAMLALGEGFHNYHHTFPHDYSASEWRWSLNLTTLFIDAMAWCGMAYDRRSVSKEAVESRIRRTGPGTSPRVKKPVEQPY